MELWMFFAIVGVIAIIIEIFYPVIFSINFAIAATITAIISVFWGNWMSLTVIFIVLSFLSILCFRPLILKYIKMPESLLKHEYEGKIVQALEPITCTQGSVTIYEERWEARIDEGEEEIPAGCDVRIKRNDSTILYVEKV